MDLKREQQNVDRISGNIRFLKRSIRQEKLQLAIATKQVSRASRSQQILQQVAQAVQQKAHDRISKVVSSCLSSVFGDEAYKFKIRFERKRGKTDADILFVRNGREADPITASGGGMVDVAAFALRVVCLVLHRPRLRPSLFLDEPFKNVSADYQDNVRVMMENISKEMQVQIILVTHNENLMIGKIIKI